MGGGKASNNIFDNHLQSSKQQFAVSPLLNSGELSRLRDELQTKSVLILNYEEQLVQANKTCDVWKAKVEEGSRKVSIYLRGTQNMLCL